MGKLLLRNFPDEKPICLPCMRSVYVKNVEKFKWRKNRARNNNNELFGLGQLQITAVDGKNHVSKSNITNSREAALPLLLDTLQLHNIFNSVSLTSTLKIFFRNSKWASGLFSSTPKCCWFISTSGSSILFCIRQKVSRLFYPFPFFLNTRKEKGTITPIQRCGSCSKTN